MFNEKEILKRIASDLNLEHIAALCRAYHVRELYLFGSAVNGDFSDRSDVDFAVRFEREGFAGSFDQYFDFKAALEKAVSRPVDLVCLPALRNSVFRKQVESTRNLVYAA